MFPNFVRIVGVVGLFGAVGLVGEGTATSGLLVELVKQVPGFGFAVLVIYWAYRYVEKQHDEHLKSKDREIERLVEERNKFQEMVLAGRLTTEHEPEVESGKTKQDGSPEKRASKPTARKSR